MNDRNRVSTIKPNHADLYINPKLEGKKRFQELKKKSYYENKRGYMRRHPEVNLPPHFDYIGDQSFLQSQENLD